MLHQNEDMLNFKEDSVFVGYDTLNTKAIVNGIFKYGNLSRFGNGKVIVNIQNITGPNGKIVRPDNIASICATQDNNQIFYIWDEYRDFTAYDAQKYPIINII